MEIQFLGQRYSTEELVKKRRSIVKGLEETEKITVSKKMLILSGSTIGEIAEQLKMFCLSHGIRLQITQGDYGRYYEDAVYGVPETDSEQYDFVYVHTSSRNILDWPEPYEDKEAVEGKLNAEKKRIQQVIASLEQKYPCPIICNNYELLPYRVMGNREIWDPSGSIYFVNRLNEFFGELAANNENVYVNDINYLSSYYGLKEWSNPSYWYRYKYAMCMAAIPLVAQNLSALVVSLCGLNKKCLVMDLDNTLWGGVVGDDGAEHLIIGNDSPQGEAYMAFQKYLSDLKKTGIILGVVSKNDEHIALEAFEREEMVLKKDDFASFKANWDTKSKNLQDMARELNLGIDSFVFVDDNPMERDEVSSNLDTVAVPMMSKVENYINEIEECRLFEGTSHTNEDSIRTTYYIQNAKREEEQNKFANYDEYLASLNMEWNFTDFEESAYERIVQLINKTNQFNLTTKRMNMNDVIERTSNSDEYLCIQGRMRDRFGDNGLITVLIGKIIDNSLHIELWLMSCRVFRRNGEYKLFDYLIQRCKEKKIAKIIGTYIPTPKNAIVSEFYQTLGFSLIEKSGEGISTWEYTI